MNPGLLAVNSESYRNGYCIYVDTIFQGSVPVVSNGQNFIVFETELEAQREIADYQMTRLQQFLSGDREFEDAIHVEEYVVPVTVSRDGVILDEFGNSFGPEVK
jgi:hypothetical protein